MYLTYDNMAYQEYHCFSENTTGGKIIQALSISEDLKYILRYYRKSNKILYRCNHKKILA